MCLLKQHWIMYDMSQWQQTTEQEAKGLALGDTAGQRRHFRWLLQLLLFLFDKGDLNLSTDANPLFRVILGTQTQEEFK